jgi:adenylate cyclase class IV
VPRNLELKARCSSLPGAREVARALPASFAGTLLQTDTYFVVPHGRCKLREFGDGKAELICYHRDESGLERWSDYTRVPVSEPVTLRRALSQALGELVTVRKRRDLFLIESARIHIDEVEGLGGFIEFEVTGGEEAERNALMGKLRGSFQIREEDCFQGSYADLLCALSAHG